MSIACRVQVYSVDEPTVLRSMTHPVLQREYYHVWRIAANASHWFVTTTRDKIHKFVIATGEHLCSFGTTGTDVGQCFHGIALYGAEVFVVDSKRNRVIVFESDGGAFVREFGDGQLCYPRMVAVNAAHVFVTDAKRVVMFDRLDGRYVRTVNIGMPCHALVCTHTFFAVSDYNQVHVFDATSGTLLHTFGSQGSGPLQFQGASGMTIVGDRLWIVDRGNHRIQIVA
jgi:DNA-binding beta-propeller fold protein YncE